MVQSALKARIIDKVLLFYAPKILGGDDGIPICRGVGPDKMNQAYPLRDMVVKRFENDILNFQINYQAFLDARKIIIIDFRFFLFRIFTFSDFSLNDKML